MQTRLNDSNDNQLAEIGVVIIGRNEALHLRNSIQSIPKSVAKVIYVDSRSTDGSMLIASSLGIEVVRINDKVPLSAARARNVGFCWLLEVAPQIKYVQFLDGDCALYSGWLESAINVIKSDSSIGAVYGHQCERLPDQSIYNSICHMEWRIPALGDVSHFGGNVLVRVVSIQAVGGYDNDMIASEDHDLSARIKQCYWQIIRIDALMAVTDTGMTKLVEWWLRCVRRGVGVVQMWERHQRRSELLTMIRIVFWAGFVPISIFALMWPTQGLAIIMLLIYPLRAIRIGFRTIRGGVSNREGILWALHCVVSSFPNFVGVLAQLSRQLMGRRACLIEYRRKH